MVAFYFRFYKITVAFALFILLGGSFVFAKDSLFNRGITVLFTSDLHSSIDAKKGDGNLVGGFARLKTLIDRERALAEERGDAVVVVDAGDMSMGSVYNILFSDYATEYTGLTKLGYDAVTFGNHCFDYGFSRLSEMFDVAASNASLDSAILPAFLCSNLVLPDGLFSPFVRQSVIKRDTIIVRNGVRVGLVGVLGEDAFSTVLDSDNISFIPAEESVLASVEKLKNDGVDYIILLAHCGTYHKRNALKSEAAMLAKAVDGIDVIVSGHDHIPLMFPVKVDNTVIGNAGCNGNYLGVLRLYGGNCDYRLVPVTVDVEPALDIVTWIDSMKNLVAAKFKAMYNVDIYKRVCSLDSAYSFERCGLKNFPLGNLIADAFKSYVVKNCNISSDSLISIIPTGSIRSGISGVVTNADIFEVLSLGIDSTGKLGYPLVLGYLYGNEIKDVVEVTPSIGNLLPDTRLSFSGIYYYYNSVSLPLFKVNNVIVNGNNLKDTILYPVVTDLFTAKLIGLMKENSFGILDVVIKHHDGTLVNNIRDIYVRDSLGNSVMAWQVFAEYLSGLNKELENSVFKDRKYDNNSKVTWLYYIVILCIITFIIIGLIKCIKYFIKK